MATIKVAYLTKRPRKNGQPRYYWQPNKALARAGWKLTRLSDDYAEALAQAQAINQQVDEWRAGRLENPTTDRPGTVSALIAAYKNSRFYKKLSDRTKADYEYFLNVIADWAGPELAGTITNKMVQDLYETWLLKSHRGAAYTVQVLRILYNFGLRENLVSHNPAARPGLDYKARKKGHVWSRAALDHLVATALDNDAQALAAAIALNYWIGQRPGDILALQPGNIQDRILKFEQSKTGSHISIPIDSLPGEALRHLNLTDDSRPLIGTPWKPRRMAQLFSGLRDSALASCQDEKLKAEIETLQFRELRHTAITHYTDAECTPAQITAISGHTVANDKNILDTYTATSYKRAEQAIAKRRKWEGI